MRSSMEINKHHRVDKIIRQERFGVTRNLVTLVLGYKDEI